MLKKSTPHVLILPSRQPRNFGDGTVRIHYYLAPHVCPGALPRPSYQERTGQIP